jgi:AraC-like DNA-binding protein
MAAPPGVRANTHCRARALCNSRQFIAFSQIPLHCAEGAAPPAARRLPPERPMLQVRAVTLTGYVEVAAFCGLDGHKMLRAAGLSPDMLADPERRLPAAVVSQLLERSAERSQCGHFGLLMAEARTFASLGPLSLLLEHLPNAREVVLEAVEFQRLLNDVVTISLEDHGETCFVRLDLAPGFWGPQTCDLMVGIAYLMLTGATGNRWRPESVQLMRAAPADLAAWRRFFPVPIQFGSDFNGLSSTSAAMLLPNPRADATMARNARRLLLQVMGGAEPGTVSDRARRVMTLLLPGGRATLQVVSAQLGLSVRTLQRELGREGQSFAGLLSAVRRELAGAYLTASARSVTEVAGLLGYASTSSFTRWFTGEFGMSPQAWRASQAADAPAKPAGPPFRWRPGR